jgi:putative sigma-54 modulation protein
MTPSVKGHDVHVGDDLRQLVAKKTARLGRFLPEWAVTDARLDLHDKPSRTGAFKQVEFTLATRGAVLRAEGKGADFASALDEAVDRMARQIVRYRTRRRDRRRQAGDEAPLPALPSEADALVAELDRSAAAEAVVRTKRFATKPMDVDEAIEQMELLGHDFFVFFNQDDRQTNVLYRRRDGGYGLLQPEAV